MPIYQHQATVETEDGPMSMFMSYPEGPGPFPAVFVISGQPGPATPEFLGAERLAQHGYVGVVPDLLHRGPTVHAYAEQGPRRRALADQQTIADMNAAMSYLQSQPYIQANNLGITGFCMGGRVAFMMAALRPEFRAAVDCYGGGILQGIGGPAPIESTANIHCPVLVLNGEADTVCTVDEVNQVVAELNKFGKVNEVHWYPGADHAFMARGPKEDMEDAWARSLAWFDRYLVRTPALAQA
ncbi:MAG TPA: dienelactone hydrolase family protein [Chloroflexota bacterium]|jgi:carboxymethylenebutenolidase